MGISSAVDWWEEWQLRILVLGSLFVQYLLFFSAPYRKLAIPSWYRSVIWLSYLGSDSLAIYALANLFSRQSRQDCHSGQGNSILEVVWAPVLLMHLGGQDCITAYNIEDNELWTRHVLTAVSQITVAIYVFCKSWPGGDKRLLQASIILFVPGILKCIEKPWALKSASFNSLVSLSDRYHHPKMTTSSVARFTELATPNRRVARSGGLHPGMASRATSNAAHHPETVNRTDRLFNWMDRLSGRMDRPSQSGAYRPRMVSRTCKEISLEDYVQKARALVLAKWPHRQSHAEADAFRFSWQRRSLLVPDSSQLQDALLSRERRLNLGAHKLFVDLASSYSDRLSMLETFLVHDVNNKAYSSLQEGLFKTFDLLYTKEKMLGEPETSYTEEDDIFTLRKLFSVYVRGAAACLPFAAIGLFHKSHREAYNVNDVKVTYALVCCTVALEIFSAFTSDLKLRSSGMVAQYSLLGFFVRNKRHAKKMSILSFFNCKDFLDQRWCMDSCTSSSTIVELVLRHVEGWWKEHIVDAENYRKFSDHRGQWTIERTECDQDLVWSINRPFDESVLLWHITTDLCFYQTSSLSVSYDNAMECRKISNYMMYLMFVNPEMLLSGTRRNLFMAANAELEEILMDDEPLLKKVLKGDKPSLMETLKGNKPFLKFLEGKGPSAEEIERGFVQRIIAKLQLRERTEEDPAYAESLMDTENYPATHEGFIQEAWKISKVLLALGDEKMWKVIEGVWVEMLCFSASRGRGYLHAKNMVTGVDLLTYIWLLLSRMGMQTLPERLQRTELSSGGGNSGATALTFQTSRIKQPTRSRRFRPHEEAAAGASTSQAQEILPAV